MTESPSRLSLRSRGLPIVLACALMGGLGGCASFRMPDFVSFGGSQSCHSDTWGTKVMGSVQRADTETYVPDYEPEPEPKPKRKRRAERKHERVAENHAPVAPPIVEETTKPLPEESAPAVEVRPEPPLAETPPETPAETQPAPLAETSPAPLAEARPEPTPNTLPPPAAPAEQPPAAQTSKQPQEEIARLPEPIPPRLQPPPEVVKVCGPNDKVCQDQLTALLSDPVHKWIGEKPTAKQQSTGVRLLAYRVLTPVLACDDLRRGREETEAATADSEAAAPEAGETYKTQDWTRLLRRAVNLELKAEIAKRC